MTKRTLDAADADEWQYSVPVEICDKKDLRILKHISLHKCQKKRTKIQESDWLRVEASEDVAEVWKKVILKNRIF